MTFGEHLTLDGYGGSREKLNNKSLVEKCLFDLPKILGMKTLCDPQVYFAEGNNLKDPGGWSGFVIIQESHISVHTFPGRAFVSADVYTCQSGLDRDRVISFFKETFDLKDTEVNFIKRGTRYPETDIIPVDLKEHLKEAIRQ